jgi:hypothetical protein
MIERGVRRKVGSAFLIGNDEFEAKVEQRVER